MENIYKNIIEKIEKGDEISPFLFIDKNTEILNEKIKSLAYKIFEKYEIPKVFFYVLENGSENIKISEIKNFVENSNKSSPYKIQIFFIQNIWKLTLQASNSLLKFFEEPWIQNLIFLSNNTESWILDTILSRVQTINFNSKEKNKKSEFYYDLIKSYINNWSNDIISYFFKAKLEKQDYLSFLENLIIFIKENFLFIEFLDEILEDINAINQNNVNAKFIIDKWILNIWK